MRLLIKFRESFHKKSKIPAARDTFVLMGRGDCDHTNTAAHIHNQVRVLDFST